MPTRRPITLRPVALTDEGFLLRVYRSTRADELVLTGWDASACETFVRMQFNAQATHYRQQWPASKQSVIEISQPGRMEPVGRLWIDQRVDAIHVLDIAVLPDWCGGGIGTECLRRLMAQAAAGGRAVTIQVELGNPARRLYDRLGFELDGPQQGLHQKMVWRQRVGTMTNRKEAFYEQA
jgi:ribosomal protein S18 acetylase RimI-like enzyme